MKSLLAFFLLSPSLFAQFSTVPSPFGQNVELDHHLTADESKSSCIEKKIVKIGEWDSFDMGNGDWSVSFSITNGSQWAIKDFKVMNGWAANSGTVLEIRTNIFFEIVPPRSTKWFRALEFHNAPNQAAVSDGVVSDFEFIDYITAPSERELLAQRDAKLSSDAAKKKLNAAIALKYNQDLASQGDSYGELRMGERYRDGDGVAKDMQKSREWFAKAAAQGDRSAKIALADLK